VTDNLYFITDKLPQLILYLYIENLDVKLLISTWYINIEMIYQCFWYINSPLVGTDFGANDE